MPPAIDVVIPLHGAWEHTERCLRHLAAQSVAHTTIVIDNASPDGTPERVRGAFPDVRLLELGVNAGFARAVNRGVAAGTAPIVVVLNNDVACAPDFLEVLAPAFDDPAVGSAAPLLLRPGGERIDGYGIVVDVTLAGFVRMQGLPAIAAEHGGAASPPLGPYGAAAAYRREALEQIGGFDERIFMYGEELDVALRLCAAGWRCAVAPGARGIHEGGATVGKRSRWQRERSGFGRGYLLRRYGVLRGRAAPRALVTELAVVLGDAAISRDVAALRGRVAGWRAARGCPRRGRPPAETIASISLIGSLRLRLGDYAAGGP